ncbi:hypothetical protein DEAB109302_02580 [Dermacoccus abyssi]
MPPRGTAAHAGRTGLLHQVSDAGQGFRFDDVVEFVRDDRGRREARSTGEALGQHPRVTRPECCGVVGHGGNAARAHPEHGSERVGRELADSQRVRVVARQVGPREVVVLATTPSWASATTRMTASALRLTSEATSAARSRLRRVCSSVSICSSNVGPSATSPTRESGETRARSAMARVSTNHASTSSSPAAPASASALVTDLRSMLYSRTPVRIMAGPCATNALTHVPLTTGSPPASAHPLAAEPRCSAH